MGIDICIDIGMNILVWELLFKRKYGLMFWFRGLFRLYGDCCYCSDKWDVYVLVEVIVWGGIELWYRYKKLLYW